MFSFFKKKKPQPGFTESVWISTAAKFEAIQKHAQTNAGQPVWLIYHFEDSATALEQVLTALSTPCKRTQRMNEASDAGTAWLMPASAIGGQLQGYSGPQPQVLVIEHYPLQARDLELYNALQQLFPGMAAQQYTGMDEPVMQQFGSERIVSMMERLGIKRDEAISHPMITKSIARALEKVAADAKGDAATSSQQAWFDTNMPKR